MEYYVGIKKDGIRVKELFLNRDEATTVEMSMMYEIMTGPFADEGAADDFAESKEDIIYLTECRVMAKNGNTVGALAASLHKKP